MALFDTSKKTVIATYLLTNSVQETAKQLHYSYSWVYRILHQVGLINVKLKKIHQSINTLNQSQINDIAVDYLSGMLTNNILLKHNINSTTLYVIVSKMNLPVRHKKRAFAWHLLPKETQANISAEVLLLYSQGLSMSEIGRQLNLPFSRVRVIINSLTKKLEVEPYVQFQ